MNPRPTVFRHEAAWTVRWMSRGSGLALMSVFALLAALEIVATSWSGRFDGLQYGLAINLAIGLEISALTFAAVAWIYFLWRRTLEFFRPTRLADILVTPLRPAELFPALLVGPTILALSFAAIWEVGVLVLPPLMGDHHYLLHLYLRPPATMTPEGLRWIQLVTVLRAPLMVIEAGALSAAYGAVAAFFMLPRGGALRLVIILLVLQLIIVPEILFSLWIDDAAVLTGSVGERNQLICDHIIGPAMTILLCWLVFRIMLQLLRGTPFWSRLSAEAASV